jgi:Fe2+ or Zn2+ uptake regulation protein
MISNMSMREKPILRRPTTQRELILKAICDSNALSGEHPTAREIFETVSASNKMSFGTVYRNLRILAEEGEIICVQTDKDAVHYDYRKDRHHHFHCQRCGGVFDVSVPYNSDIDKEVAKNNAFVIKFHATTFEGLCSECVSAES